MDLYLSFNQAFDCVAPLLVPDVKLGELELEKVGIMSTENSRIC